MDAYVSKMNGVTIYKVIRGTVDMDRVDGGQVVLKSTTREDDKIVIRTSIKRLQVAVR